MLLFGFMWKICAKARLSSGFGETQWFAQPIGFWTNLAYVGVGLFILWLAGRDTAGRTADTAENPDRSPLIGVTPYAYLNGFICISIGIGSMMLHGSNRSWGGSIDCITMVWFITFVFMYSLSRVLQLPRRGFFWIFGVWNGVIVVLEITAVYSAYDWLCSSCLSHLRGNSSVSCCITSKPPVPNQGISRTGLAVVARVDRELRHCVRVLESPAKWQSRVRPQFVVPGPWRVAYFDCLCDLVRFSVPPV